MTDPSQDRPDPADRAGGEVVPAEVVGPGDGSAPDGGLGAVLGGLDLGSMMEMAQQMGDRVAEAQEQLAHARVEGTAGGGVVRVVLNGHLHLKEVHIDPAAVDPEDPTMLEDLIVAAFADAQSEVAELQAQADPMSGLGGMGGLGGLLGG